METKQREKGEGEDGQSVHECVESVEVEEEEEEEEYDDNSEKQKEKEEEESRTRKQTTFFVCGGVECQQLFGRWLCFSWSSKIWNNR